MSKKSPLREMCQVIDLGEKVWDKMPAGAQATIGDTDKRALVLYLIDQLGYDMKTQAEVWSSLFD